MVRPYRSPEVVNVGDVVSLTRGNKKGYVDYLGNTSTEFTGPTDDDGKKREVDPVPESEPDEEEDKPRES